MKNKRPSLTFCCLFFLMAFLAEIYCMLEFRSNLIIIIGVSTIVLIATYLLIEILRLEIYNSRRSIERKLNAKYEDIKKMEKAIYNAIKNNGTTIDEKLDELAWIGKSIIKYQKDVGRGIVKFNKENTVRLLSKINNTNQILVNNMEMIHNSIETISNSNNSSNSEDIQNILISTKEIISFLTEIQHITLEIRTNSEGNSTPDLEELTKLLSNHNEELIVKLNDFMTLTENNAKDFANKLHTNYSESSPAEFYEPPIHDEVIEDINEDLTEEIVEDIIEEDNTPNVELDLINEALSEESIELPETQEEKDELSPVDIDETIEDLPIELDEITEELSIEPQEITEVEISPEPIEEHIGEPIIEIEEIAEPKPKRKRKKPEPKEPIKEEIKEEPKIPEIKVDPANANKQLNADEIAAMFAQASETPEPVKEEIKEEPKVPEVKADPANANKQLSADEIAAMFAQASGTPEPVKEEIKEEPKVPEVKADPANANKQLSADEIAALFASVN